MKTINSFFEYMFYRVAKAYSRWDIDPGSTGIWAIICCQAFLIIDLIILLTYVFLDRYERISFFRYSKFGIILLVIILFRYSYKKYNGTYWTLHMKWRDESKPQKIKKGILVVLVILLPIVIPMIIVSI